MSHHNSLPTNPSQSTKRRNPHLWQDKGEGVYRRRKDNALYINIDHENSSGVAGLPATKPEQDQIPALDQGKKTHARRKGGLALIVTLIRCSQRLLDDDNLCASFKATRDSIATSLGVADNDKQVRWEYGQVVSGGRVGTVVKFTLL